MACEWCGRENTKGVCPWSLKCPTCGANPGVKCKRPSGYSCEMHAARYLKAEAMGEPARQPGIFDRLEGGGIS
jgi:hypothetical protein